MKPRLLIAALPLLAGLASCATPPVTAESLKTMSPSQVCREIGVAHYRADMNTFALARDEADRRIAAGTITADACAADTAQGFRRASDVYNERQRTAM